MIKNADKRKGPIEIDLRGPEGNVFILMNYARDLARQLYPCMTDEMKENLANIELLEGLGIEDVENVNHIYKNPDTLSKFIINKMTESDYDHALEVFDSYFGKWVILWK